MSEIAAMLFSEAVALDAGQLSQQVRAYRLETVGGLTERFREGKEQYNYAFTSIEHVRSMGSPQPQRIQRSEWIRML